jgi:N-acetyltransferase
MKETASETSPPVGQHVRVEPLTVAHVPGIEAAASEDPALYRWSPVPEGADATAAYVRQALELRDRREAVPFAIIRRADDALIGCTRFWKLEWWAWPEGHERFARSAPDACEIGYTWLARSAIRTAANTETKLLLLTHAFEDWGVLRVSFHADARNERSRAALERIGATFEGILRAHRLAVDLVPRDSARFSITEDEWPAVKTRLIQLLDR